MHRLYTSYTTQLCFILSAVKCYTFCTMSQIWTICINCHLKLFRAAVLALLTNYILSSFAFFLPFWQESQHKLLAHIWRTWHIVCAGDLHAVQCDRHKCKFCMLLTSGFKLNFEDFVTIEALIRSLISSYFLPYLFVFFRLIFEVTSRDPALFLL